MMPTITEAPVEGYAHCIDARCPGYNQQPVGAVREETALTFGELGGDGVFVNFVERSTVRFRFADEDEQACPECGGTREVSGEPRPSYLPLSGHDPMGLVGGQKFNPAVVNTEQDAAMAEMEAKLARMEATLAAALGDGES